MDDTIVSFSELDTYRQCPHKWALAYRQRWVPETTSPSLVRGTNMHAALEGIYKNAQQGAKGKYELLLGTQSCWMNTDGTQNEEQLLLDWMIDGYVDYYTNADGVLDVFWEVIDIELSFEVDLPIAGLVMKGKIDLIVRDPKGRIWVVDHKSCKNLPRSVELDLNDQFGGYVWAMRQLGMDVHGSIYNAVRTQKNKTKEQLLEERFLRIPTYRTQVELDTIALEIARSMQHAYAIPEGEEPRHTNPETCKWKCAYTDACLHGRKGYDQVDFLTSAGFVQDFTRH